MAKTKCPICGVEGFLQQRGKNVRVQHYVGFKDGKRVYVYHKANNDLHSGGRGSKSLRSTSFRERRLFCYLGQSQLKKTGKDHSSMVMWVAMRTYDITLFEDIVMCDVNKENSSDLYPYMKEQTNTLGYLDDKIEATKRYEKIG